MRTQSIVQREESSAVPCPASPILHAWSAESDSELVIDVAGAVDAPDRTFNCPAATALEELSEQFDGRDDEAILGLAAEEFTTDAWQHPERYESLARWFAAEATQRHVPKLVLDVGCGPGVLTQHVARLLPTAKVMGIDLSPDMLRLAEQGKSVDRVQFIGGDAREALDIAERPVDGVISRRMIHRVDGLETVLKRLAGAVHADGGVVLNYSFRRPTEERGLREFLDAAAQRGQFKSLHAAFVRAVLNAPTLDEYVVAARSVAETFGVSRCQIKVFPFDVGVLLVR